MTNLGAHEIDVVQYQPCLSEAVVNGASREARAVFLAVESLLRGRSYGDAIHHQGGGSIVPLRYPVIARIETWPVSLLERHGLLQTTDS